MRTTATPAGVVPTGDLLAQRRRSQLMRRRSTFAGAADLLRDSEPKKGNDASGKDAPAASTAKCVLPLDYSLLYFDIFWCLGRGWEIIVSAAHLKCVWSPPGHVYLCCMVATRRAVAHIMFD